MILLCRSVRGGVRIKRILILLFSILVIFNNVIFAEEIEKNETEDNIQEELSIYQFPDIKPKFYGFIGYRFIDLNGSERADEFEYLHSAIAATGLFIAFPFPHRLHLELDVLNKNDFFGDVRYAYKDAIMFRGVTRKIFHNLDNVTLVDSGTSALYAVDREDAGEKYGVKQSMSNLFLRFKMPQFPFHIYLNGDFITKNGTQQQRFLADYGSIDRKSTKREIDWNSRDIGIGANSHLGPVEVDVSHSEKRLEINKENIMESSYDGRILPHNLMPEIKGSTTSLKLHTLYTGRLVAAATLSWIDRENMDSKAKVGYFIGAGDLTYMPHERLTFFVKYRQEKTDMENPDTIPVNYLGYSDYTSSITVKPSISSNVDKLSSTVRYRPINRLTLNAEYIYERTERDNADEWKIARVTTRDILSFSLNTSIIKKLTLRAKYTHQEADAPAYNNQPDSSDEGKVSLSWSPLKWTYALLSYSIMKENRDNIYYIDEGVQVTANNRERRLDRLLGSISFIVFDNLTITTSYYYLRNKTEQDLLYDNTGLNPGYHTDSGVLYKDSSHTYAANVNYIPKKKINLNADVSYTESKGNFYPGNPLSATSLSESETNVKIRETNCVVRGDYEFKKGWGLGVKYNYVDYNDLLNNSNDGILHVLLVTISKKW
jgi:hypothetical protein